MSSIQRPPREAWSGSTHHGDCTCPPAGTWWLSGGDWVQGRSAGDGRGSGGGTGTGAGEWGGVGGRRARSQGGGRRGAPRASDLQDPVPQPGDPGVDPWTPRFCTANAPAHDARQEEPARGLLADQGPSRVALGNTRWGNPQNRRVRGGPAPGLKSLWAPEFPAVGGNKTNNQDVWASEPLTGLLTLTPQPEARSSARRNNIPSVPPPVSHRPLMTPRRPPGLTAAAAVGQVLSLPDLPPQPAWWPCLSPHPARQTVFFWFCGLKD